jgi:hypothetical protein
MAILLTCACGKQFRAKDEFAGKTMKCRNCGVTLIIPDAGPTSSSGDALGSTPSPQARVTTPSQVGRTPMPSERVASKPGVFKAPEAGVVSSSRLPRPAPVADPLANTAPPPVQRRRRPLGRRALWAWIAAGSGLFLLFLCGGGFYLWWGRTSDIDIGNPGFKGSTTKTDVNSFEISAGGADIWGKEDQCHFYSRRIVGDFDLEVCVQQIEGMEPVNPWAKAGLMARADLTDKSPQVSMFATPRSGYALQRRVMPGGDSTTFPEVGKGEQCPWPSAWVRLQRVGQDFTGYTSADGQQWTKVLKVNMRDFPTVAHVGLAVTSHDRSRTVKVTFTKFRPHEGR